MNGLHTHLPGRALHHYTIMITTGGYPLSEVPSAMTSTSVASRADFQHRLLEILKDIAYASQLELIAAQLLEAALRFTGAQSASFRLFAPPFTLITAGQPDTNSSADYERLAAALPAGIHVSPALSPEVIHLADHSVVVPIYAADQLNGVLWLWLAQPYNLDSDNLGNMTALASAFHLLAIRLIAQERQISIEHKLQSLMDHLTDPLIIFDVSWQVLYINSAARALAGESWQASSPSVLDQITALGGIVAIDEGVPGTVSEWQSADGRTFQPRLAAIQHPSGYQEGWILALRDLTQFKKLSRNQSEFTRIVSHDLRSPLTSVQGFASMLEQQMVGDLNERQAHFVNKILSGVAQMTALVDNIQDAGRYDPETGFYELSRSPCDLNEIVNRIVDSHLVPAEKELAIEVKVAGDVPIIHADGNMIERAIINLFDNAIKYTPSGGSVRIEVKRHSDQVTIAVSDTGLGIKPDDQKRLFERHVRLARPEHKKIKGSGLGLFIVRSIAQRHGGDAWVESAEGQGSTFYFSIPLQVSGRGSAAS